MSTSSIVGGGLPPPIPTVRTQAVAAGNASQAVSRANAGTQVNVVPSGSEGLVQTGTEVSALPPVDPTGNAQSLLGQNNGKSPERSGEASWPTTSLGSSSYGSSSKGGVAVDAQPAGAASVPGQNAEGNKTAGATQGQGKGGASGQDQGTDQGQDAAAAAAQAAAAAARFPGELPPEYESPEQKAMDQRINNFVADLWKASAAAVTTSSSAGGGAPTVSGAGATPPEGGSKGSIQAVNVRV